MGAAGRAVAWMEAHLYCYQHGLQQRAVEMETASHDVAWKEGKLYCKQRGLALCLMWMAAVQEGQHYCKYDDLLLGIVQMAAVPKGKLYCEQHHLRLQFVQVEVGIGQAVVLMEVQLYGKKHGKPLSLAQMASN